MWSKWSVLMVSGALALIFSTVANADTAASLLARYKTVSGGARWDEVKTLQASGIHSSGGLNGRWHVIQDLSTGRFSDAYKLGSFDNADGYDGIHAWRRDPGGEVATLDGPVAIRSARTRAWLDARAYWFPSRIRASYGATEDRQLNGKHYRVVKATPEGGAPVVLWFDAGSGLLVRVVEREAQYVSVTILDDYREVDGLRLPYHVLTDFTDSAGRTDPRRRIEIRYDSMAVNVAADDADFAIPSMARTGHVANASGVTRVPFDLINNHIYVDGVVNGKSARFMVDSGGVNMLTPAAARKFGLASEGAQAVDGAGDHDVDMGYAPAKSLRVGDAVLADPVFIVLDLGDMPKVEGVEFDGFVGYEMLRRFGTTIDYEHRVLTFAEPARFRPPVGATAVKFDQDDRAPNIEGTLDGVPIRLWVDTGSRSSLSFFSPFVRQHHLLDKYRAGSDAVVGWGFSGASYAHPARLGTLRIGKLAVDGIAGDLATTDKGAFADPDQDADLGGGTLRRFTVAFDYPAKRLYFLPNARKSGPDPFDRSGLWLLVDGDALKVVDVAKGSAADQAHLRDNDRIVSIAGEAVATRPISEWRARLCELPAGTKLTIGFRRAGRTASTELVLVDRIPPTWKKTGRTE